MEPEIRQAFEEFIGGPPFELSIERFPDDPRKHAWPGSYRILEVQTAWEAWKAATEISNTCQDGCKIKRAVKEFSQGTTGDY